MRLVIRLACAVLVCGTLVSPAAAQRVRLSGTSTLRFIELRPLARDSVLASDVAGTGLLRQLQDGRTVRCVPGDAFCRYSVPDDPVSLLPLTHDIEASAWGFGRGLRAYTQLRTRSAWGTGAELWPQADDALDLLAAFAELDRERVRVRVGRQWQVSGLGLYNFDGIDIGTTPVEGLWLEGYGGRSLVRGLNESRAGGALAAVEDRAPSVNGVLAGLRARFRPSSRLALGGAYQVEFRTDGAGLFSELGSADVIWRVRGGSVEAAVELDVATTSLNEARIRLLSPPLGRLVAHAEGRRYRPYFELWTIWGAFSPVGFDELRGGVAWSGAAGALGLRSEAWYRKYGQASIANPIDVLSGTARGLSAAAEWTPASSWRVDASYQVEGGFGAARRDVHAGVTREFGDLAVVSLQALAFQRLYEFRLAEGTVYGIAAEGGVRVHSRAELLATAAAYQHGGSGSGSGVDWTQRRGSVRLRWTLGSEPAPRLPAGRRP